MAAAGPSSSAASGSHHHHHDHSQSAVGAGGETGAPGALVERNSGAFRFWHDERRFKGTIDKCLVQQALFAAGGVRTGGYPKAAPVSGPLGYQRPGDWDLLWSPARSALRAVPGVKPGQLVSAVPGLYSLTKKRRLSSTLRAAYGADAWRLVPHSYSLPQELPEWQAWLQEREEGGEDPGPWMLKTAQHLGKGLVLLPGAAAAEAAQQPRLPSAKPFVLAQRYISDPLLINGCKFGIRLWLLVTGIHPFTAYMHNQGLVLFSTDSYDLDSLSDEEGAAGKGHVTNYAQNENGTVWNLPMLKQHLGADAYRSLWVKLVSNAAHIACAAMGEVRREHERQHVPPNSTFELLGLDYLVDANMHPWLLEVNGTPSLAVAHHDPAVEQLIRGTKSAMVRDMVSIMDVSSRFRVRYGLHRSGAKMSASGAQRAQRALLQTSEAAAQRRVDAELQQRGGFVPLMGHFPVMRAAAAAAAAVPLASPVAAAAAGAAAGSSALEPASSSGSHAAAAGGSGAAPTTAGASSQGASTEAAEAGSSGAGAGSGGSSDGGLHFTDCDKRLFVHMQQWWQKHRASAARRRLVPGRKRLRHAAAAADGASTAAQAAEPAAESVPMDV